MKRSLVLRAASVLAASCTVLGAAARERIVLHVDIDERVNAVYHLACLAGASTLPAEGLALRLD